jgi:hypothetical protein
MSSGRLWFSNPGFHYYNDFPYLGITLCADKRGCTTLGLLILSVVFHPEPESVVLELTHSGSQIEQLVVSSDRVIPDADDFSVGYRATASSYSHRPARMAKHPCHDRLAPVDPCDLPWIAVSQGFNPNRAHHYEDRSIVRHVEGFGTDEGQFRMACLLLNGGLDDNEQVEFVLESEVGFRGVAPGSAELSIGLPGSGHYCEDDR